MPTAVVAGTSAGWVRRYRGAGGGPEALRVTVTVEGTEKE